MAKLISRGRRSVEERPPPGPPEHIIVRQAPADHRRSSNLSIRSDPAPNERISPVWKLVIAILVGVILVSSFQSYFIWKENTQHYEALAGALGKLEPKTVTTVTTSTILASITITATSVKTATITTRVINATITVTKS